jgi:hypothetical protein
MTPPQSSSSPSEIFSVVSLEACRRPEEAALDPFLRAIDTRVRAGTLRWASVADMLDAYAEWESSHR